MHHSRLTILSLTFFLFFGAAARADFYNSGYVYGYSVSCGVTACDAATADLPGLITKSNQCVVSRLNLPAKISVYDAERKCVTPREAESGESTALGSCCIQHLPTDHFCTLICKASFKNPAPPAVLPSGAALKRERPALGCNQYPDNLNSKMTHANTLFDSELYQKLLSQQLGDIYAGAKEAYHYYYRTQLAEGSAEGVAELRKEEADIDAILERQYGATEGECFKTLQARMLDAYANHFTDDQLVKMDAIHDALIPPARWLPQTGLISNKTDDTALLQAFNGFTGEHDAIVQGVGKTLKSDFIATTCYDIRIYEGPLSVKVTEGGAGSIGRTTYTFKPCLVPGYSEE